VFFRYLVQAGFSFVVPLLLSVTLELSTPAIIALLSIDAPLERTE
jgi:hypothetical protein